MGRLVTACVCVSNDLSPVAPQHRSGARQQLWVLVTNFLGVQAVNLVPPWQRAEPVLPGPECGRWQLNVTASLQPSIHEKQRKGTASRCHFSGEVAPGPEVTSLSSSGFPSRTHVLGFGST